MCIDDREGWRERDGEGGVEAGAGDVEDGCVWDGAADVLQGIVGERGSDDDVSIALKSFHARTGALQPAMDTLGRGQSCGSKRAVEASYRVHGMTNDIRVEFVKPTDAGLGTRGFDIILGQEKVDTQIRFSHTLVINNGELADARQDEVL